MSAQELDGRKEVKAERGGGWGGEMVYEGDRVIVVGEGGPESRERGKIGKVAEVKRKEGAVVVEGLNMVSGENFGGVLGLTLGKSRSLREMLRL